MVDPQLSPDPKLTKAYSENSTLPAAVALAESMRAQYASKVEDQILLDRVVGLTLIGAASTVAGLATTGAAAVPIIATTLGGAAAFGADSFLSSKPQQFIYAAGANAVQCALDSMQPMIVAYPSRIHLRELIDGPPALIVQIRTAEQYMAGFKNYTDSPVYVRAAAAVQQGRAIIQPATDAYLAMQNSGGTLRQSLSRIELQVTNAIISSSPSIPALAQSLGFALPAIGKPLNLPPSPSIPQAGGKFENEDEQKLLTATIAIEQTIAEITTIIAAVNQRPSADQLKTCNVDLTQAGLKITINPSGEISIATPSGDTTNAATVIATGGVLPYSAEWYGNSPADTEVVKSPVSGQGILTITAKKGAKPNAYGLIVFDAANNSASTSVRIVAPSGQPAAKIDNAAAKVASESCTKDPTTQKVQAFLLQSNIQKVQVGATEKTLIADGCYGDVTASAIQLFLRKKGLHDDEIPKDQNDLINSMVDLLPK